MFIIRIFLFVGFFGMFAGVYHDSTPLTLATGFMFSAGIRMVSSFPQSIMLINNNDKGDKDNE